MDKLGKFELHEQIGRGAMAVVYKAWDPSMKRWVAVKKMNSELAENRDQLDRFIDEAITAGNLHHENIVIIYESRQDTDKPFIAMEYLDGGSLDKIIQSHAGLPLSQKVGYIVHVCRALSHAHRQRVIHRDIKPSNVMLSAEGVVKVVDFGIARLGDSSRTQTGTVIGTLGYMSPQLVGGQNADARSDIWAVGVMFYELLAYQRPFEGKSAGELIANIQSQSTPLILDTAPDTPSDVAAVVERMLRKNVSERFQSMDEILIELEPIWRKLQEAEVAGLVAVSKQLFGEGNLSGAQNAAIKALQIDTSNLEAKSILDRIKTEFRRREVLPKVEAHLQKGQNFLALGQIEKAQAEVEAALNLDSSSIPAHELLDQVELAYEKARALERNLRISKQRLAEGAITEAEIQLTKVFESEPANPAAQELLKQVQAEKARRERQKRLSDVLRHARMLWTDSQYDQCIEVLLQAKSEFPREGEIDKLLETARQDQAEQERQSMLAGARSLLRAEKFDEALKKLEEVLQRHPGDGTTKNLYRLVLQAQEQQVRDRHFQAEMTGLRVLVRDGKYKEVITRGENLHGEFPDETQLGELIAFARAEEAQQELRLHLERLTDQVKQEMGGGRFREAIQAAEAALREFPQNPEFAILLQRAKAQQAEKERRELRDKRVVEVRSLLDRGELSRAIELAKRGLEAVGPDTELRRLQLEAEAEYEEREKARRKQIEVLDEARTFLTAGKIGEAEKALKLAVESSLLPETDTRVTALLREIEEQRLQLERAERERQRRLSDTLRRARLLWTGLRYRECMEVLEAARKEFSGEPEIEKLLQTARHDEEERETAEKQKRAQLAEARNLIAAKQYDGALTILDQVLRQSPTDQESADLRAKAQQCRQEQIRERRLQADIEKLNKAVEAGKYQEAIAEAEKLQQEFPERPDVRQLVEVARDAQAQLESKRRQERLVAEVSRQVASGLYREAVLAAAQALNEFPKNSELIALRERAKAEVAEKARRDLRDRRVAEIQDLILAGKLTEALERVKQTVETLGRDPEIQRLESKAQAEFDHRQEKKQRQEEVLKELGALMSAGKLEEATKVLQAATQESLLADSDPRVESLRRQIENKRRQLDQAERERQKRLAEVLRRARTLWTGLSYRQCIEILTEAKKEFPGEPEITKLLETAQRDEAERDKEQKQRQAQVAEARKLCGEKHFEEALTILDQVLQRSPTDLSAKELRGTARQGHQEQIRQKQVRDDLSKLRKMVEQEKYQEAIAWGEKLGQDNPRDAEIPRLITEARNGQVRLQRKQKLDQWSEKVQMDLKSGRFREAIKSAESALKEFPQNPALMTLLQRVKSQQDETEKRELLDKRIAEIEAKISKDDLKGAIKIAVRTLETMGPDAEIGNLLQSARTEIEHRENRKRDQDETLENAHAMLRAGHAADAAKILERAISIGLFSSADHDVAELRREIEKAQSRLEAEFQKPVENKAHARSEVASQTIPPLEYARAVPGDVTLMVRPSPAPKRVPSEDAAATVRNADPSPVSNEVARAQVAAGPDQTEALQRVEKLLAAILGPLAILIVKKARNSAADPKAQFDFILGSLRAESDRQKLLNARDEVLSSLRTLPPVEGSASGTTIAVSPRKLRQLDPESIARASARLAKYLGPIAKVLTERAARKAESVEQLHELLAEHLTNKDDRARFLAEVGVTD